MTDGTEQIDRINKVDFVDESAPPDFREMNAFDPPKVISEYDAFDSQRLKDNDNTITNKNTYTHRLFWLMLGWMVAVVLILIASGVKVPDNLPQDHCVWTWCRWCGSFSLSDTVLLALIGATTANVIGLFAVVAKYLFTESQLHAPNNKTK